MFIDLRQEPLPLGSGMAIVQQVVRAVLVRLAQATAWPVVMRHDFAQRNIMLVHQVGGQLCGALNRCRPAVATVFTHLNADRISVPGAIKVCMFTLLIGREMLYGAILVGGVMPNQVTDAVAAPAFAGAQLAILESQRVAQGIGPGGKILGTVNGDIAGLHTPVILAGVSTAWDQVLLHIHLTVEGRRAFARGGGNQITTARTGGCAVTGSRR